MAVIETKFDVGDTVWHATTINATRQHPCPDCLGERKWTARSPAGTDYEVACPRCAESYMSNRTLSLTYIWHEPTVSKLTIGLVQANSDTHSGPAPKHQYMCLETGIGSGRVYPEDVLFSSEEDALAAATLAAGFYNSDPSGWPAKQYAGTARFCDYQLNDAAVKSAEAALRSLGYRFQDLLENLKEAGSLAEVRERIIGWEEGGE